MKIVTIVWISTNLLLMAGTESFSNLLFREGFDTNQISNDWHWLRENPAGWNIEKGTLRIRTNGSLWESNNTQQNILLRELPENSATAINVEVTVNGSLQLTQRYEHGGLIWYLDDDNWVTLTLLNHVQHKTQKIMLVHEAGGQGRDTESKAEPFNEEQVELRLNIDNNVFTGYYRRGAGYEWTRLGSITFPKSDQAPQAGLVAGDCPNKIEHWVTFDNFILQRAD